MPKSMNITYGKGIPGTGIPGWKTAYLILASV